MKLGNMVINTNNLVLAILAATFTAAYMSILLIFARDKFFDGILILFSVILGFIISILLFNIQEEIKENTNRDRIKTSIIEEINRIIPCFEKSSKLKPGDAYTYNHIVLGSLDVAIDSSLFNSSSTCLMNTIVSNISLYNSQSLAIDALLANNIERPEYLAKKYANLIELSKAIFTDLKELKTKLDQ